MIYAKINFCDRIEVYEVEKDNSEEEESTQKQEDSSDDDSKFQED